MRLRTMEPSREFVYATPEHNRESFADERKIPAPGFRPREPRYARKLAWNGHPSTREKAASYFSNRDFSVDTLRQLIRESVDAERPDVRELRRVRRSRRYHDHRRLQLVHRLGERWAVFDA